MNKNERAMIDVGGFILKLFIAIASLGVAIAVFAYAILAFHPQSEKSTKAAHRYYQTGTTECDDPGVHCITTPPKK